MNHQVILSGGTCAHTHCAYMYIPHIIIKEIQVNNFLLTTSAAVTVITSGTAAPGSTVGVATSVVALGTNALGAAPDVVTLGTAALGSTVGVATVVTLGTAAPGSTVGATTAVVTAVTMGTVDTLARADVKTTGDTVAAVGVRATCGFTATCGFRDLAGCGAVRGFGGTAGFVPAACFRTDTGATVVVNAWATVGTVVEAVTGAEGDDAMVVGGTEVTTTSGCGMMIFLLVTCSAKDINNTMYLKSTSLCHNTNRCTVHYNICFLIEDHSI